MIKDLKDIKREEVNLFGGKAVNLGFLIQNGFNVPEGFCISTKINKIDNKTKDNIISKFKKLKSKVAVRSSATDEDSEKSSFAGQFDSFLNIQNEKQLFNAIKNCKNSIKLDRAKAYLKNKKLNDIKMAVIVQKMVDADYAGVIFTVDPVDKNYVLIEVTRGLGDKLVSGEITPDNYFVDRKTLKIKNKSVSFKFHNNIIKNLSKTALKIESTYKFPQDIEFCIKNDKIFVLQSRPITTL